MFAHKHRLCGSLAASALSASMLFAGTVPASAATPSETRMPARFQTSAVERIDITVTNLPWAFCLTYNGTPRENITIYAPSPKDAFILADQAVSRANIGALILGYPALWRWRGGTC